MGGTSFDVALIADGEPVLAPQTTIDFGMVVRTPMIEITTIGAGGGSIAWVDAGGLLQVGPGIGGLRSRPGLLRPRQHAADRDRRQCRARPHQRRTGRSAASSKRLDVEAARAAHRAHVGAAARPRR